MLKKDSVPTLHPVQSGSVPLTSSRYGEDLSDFNRKCHWSDWKIGQIQLCSACAFWTPNLKNLLHMLNRNRSTDQRGYFLDDGTPAVLVLQSHSEGKWRKWKTERRHWRLGDLKRARWGKRQIAPPPPRMSLEGARKSST